MIKSNTRQHKVLATNKRKLGNIDAKKKTKQNDYVAAATVAEASAAEKEAKKNEPTSLVLF